MMYPKVEPVNIISLFHILLHLALLCIPTVGVVAEHVALASIRDSAVQNLWVAGLRCHSSQGTGTTSETP